MYRKKKVEQCNVTETAERWRRNIEGINQIDYDIYVCIYIGFPSCTSGKEPTYQ